MYSTTYATDKADGRPHPAPQWWVRVVKRVLKTVLVIGFLALVLILLSNWWITYSTRRQIYFDIGQLPANDVGLVLGTSKWIRKGQENLFFRYRMEATARLWKEGKVKYLILSGNNDSQYYNEPADMQQALIKLGIPADVMTLDYAGYRTFDSVVRCKELFNQEKITVISQNFHNARAVFIANHEGMDAIAFAAQDVPDGYSIRTMLREYLARPQALIDIYLLRPAVPTENWRNRDR